MIASPNIPLPLYGRPPIDDYLLDQQRLTAVERFARLHEEGAAPAQAKYYRDLIPLTAPDAGQQYAFEVDLDACTGCKSCVAACHQLNGLDPGETWRDVGLLIGPAAGADEPPLHQHVTSACHHCLEPACLEGCPVNAYEKDPVTGIVRHLDDQCIGCQYCILKCPYDVPKFNKAKGIVRKCDMCSDRLAVGEAPACVQACPNEAIRITVVDKAKVRADAQAHRFLAGAPEPDYTLPTTQFKSARPLAPGTIPADYHTFRPEHAHTSLIVMLVLTQLSVGAFLIGRLVEAVGGGVFELVRPVHALMSMGVGLLALAAATLHLGRPLYAFRAVIGLRTSWLSREIIAFGAFAKLAMSYAALSWWAPDLLGGTPLKLLGASVVASGVLGVFCSAMIYHDTRRVFWKLHRTITKFALTSLILGLSTTLLAGLIAAACSQELTIEQFVEDWGRKLCGWLAIAAAAKLIVDAAPFVHLWQKEPTPLRRTAMLMVGPLHQPTIARLLTGFVGGVAAPVLFTLTRPDGADRTIVCIVIALIFTLTVVSELLERYLFFTAVVAPKMPGGVR